MGIQFIGAGIPLKRRELEALYVACSIIMQQDHLTERSRKDYENLHKRLLDYLETSEASEYAIQPTYKE